MASSQGCPPPSLRSTRILVNPRSSRSSSDCSETEHCSFGWSHAAVQTIITEQWFHLPSVELDLQEGDELVFAALVTDQYGRQIVTPSLPASRVEGDEITWFSTSFDFPSEPDGWGLAG